MRIFGITGSLSSGKTTASKFLSKKRGPLFSADYIVKKLYSNNKFKKLLSKNFNINNFTNIKKSLRDKILKDKSNIKKLEKITHPLVRKKMKTFLIKNKNKKFVFLEIPLLVESKLMNYFDIIFYIKANKKIRMKRFKSKGGNKMIFNILNKKQLADVKKTKFCDHIVVNESTLNILNTKLSDIFNKYE